MWGIWAPSSPSLQLLLPGREVSAFHREPMFYQTQSRGRGRCPPQTDCRDPHHLPVVTHSVFPDRPAHLGHAIPGLLSQQRQQPKGKQGALRPHVRHNPSTYREPAGAQHSCLSTSLLPTASLCKYLWKCDQEMSTGDTSMDSQFPHLCQP